MAVSIDDLLRIIGSKEAQIFQLSRDNNALQQELHRLSLPPAPTTQPVNILPFPVNRNGETD